MKWIYLLIAVTAEVAGTSALKASEGFTRPGPSAGVIIGYGAAFYFLSLTLDSIPLGVAYALWSGIGIVFISLIDWRFFGQALDGPAMLGIGLIVAGVMVLNIFSKSAAH